MPPEVWRGRACPASDQYSLALTYAELRLDRRVFTSRELPELMLAQMQHTPDLTGTTIQEQQVLLQALAKDPKRRFDSCLDFVRKLHGAAIDGGALMAGSGFMQALLRGGWRNRSKVSRAT